MAFCRNMSNETLYTQKIGNGNSCLYSQKGRYGIDLHFKIDVCFEMFAFIILTSNEKLYCA